MEISPRTPRFPPRSPRPPFRPDMSASSSLEGMEKTWETHRPARIESIIDLYSEKPLPMPPVGKRRSSSCGGSKDVSPLSPSFGSREFSPLSPSFYNVSSDVSPTSPTSGSDEGSSSKSFRMVLRRSASSGMFERMVARSLLEARNSGPVEEKGVLRTGEVKAGHVLKVESGEPKRASSERKNIEGDRGRDANPAIRVTQEDKSETMFSEWRAPPAWESDDEPNPGSPTIASVLGHKDVEASRRKSGSKERSGSRSRNRSANSSKLRASPAFDALDAESKQSPASLSSRILNVADESFTPLHLEVSTEEGRPSSHFSSESSDAENTPRNKIKGFKAYTRHPFQSRNSSKNETPRKESPKLPVEATASPKTSRRQTRITSMVKQQRQSMQQGVSGMYETLQTLYLPTPAPKAKTQSAGSERKGIPRELRKPAIPLSPYQKYGTKAWEAEKAPQRRKTKFGKRSQANTVESTSSETSWPRYKSARSTQVSTSSVSSKEATSPTKIRAQVERHSTQGSQKGRSVGKKLAVAFQNGTAQMENAVGLGKTKQKREERREELKRKIVVIMPNGHF